MSDSSKEHTGEVIQCVDALTRDILSGTISPGQSFDTEALRRTLNVDSGVLNEALFRLSMSGFVELHSKQGVVVRKVSEHEILDLYETFIHIELLAVKLAIRRMSAEQETKILSTLYKIALIEKSQMTLTYVEWEKIADEFHYTLVEACGSKQLLQIRRQLNDEIAHFNHLVFFAKSAHLDVAYAEHEAIAKAVIAREENKACQLMLEHIGSPHETLLPLLARRGWLNL